jgi:hypothetical protein
MAIKSTDVVTQLLPFAETKRQEDCQQQHYDSHTINRAIERNPGATISQLVLLTGLPESRIIEHVDHFANKLKLPKLRVTSSA